MILDLLLHGSETPELAAKHSWLLRGGPSPIPLAAWMTPCTLKVLLKDGHTGDKRHLRFVLPHASDAWPVARS